MRRISFIIAITVGGILVATLLILPRFQHKEEEIPSPQVSQKSFQPHLIRKQVDPRAQKVLDAGLQSKDMKHREVSAMFISKSRNPNVLSLLSHFKNDDADTEVKLFSSVAAAKMGDNSVKPFLDEISGNSVLPVLLIQSAVGLSALGDEKGYKLLSELLKHPDPFFRMEAARATGEVPGNDEEMIALLLPLLQDEKDYVRVAAAGALLRHGNTSGLHILLGGLNSPDSAVQYSAAFPLAEAGYMEAYPFLKDQYEKYDDITVRARVGYYLALLGDTSGLGAVEEGLYSEDLETRYFSAVALSELPD